MALVFLSDDAKVGGVVDEFEIAYNAANLGVRTLVELKGMWYNYDDIGAVNSDWIQFGNDASLNDKIISFVVWVQSSNSIYAFSRVFFNTDTETFVNDTFSGPGFGANPTSGDGPTKVELTDYILYYAAYVEEPALPLDEEPKQNNLGIYLIISVPIVFALGYVFFRLNKK